MQTHKSSVKEFNSVERSPGQKNSFVVTAQTEISLQPYKMKIEITQEIRDKARELAEEFVKLNVKDKEKHIFKTENNFEKKRMGFIGELAFEEYLKEKEILYITDDCLFRGDKFDFKINRKSFDVKTTKWLTYEKHNALLINKIQADKNKTDYFVCVVIHFNFAEIWGFISNEETLKLEVKEKLDSPAYVIEKEDLTRIKKLGEIL